ncbi:hypothetical protein BJ165DRAFT_1496557 [Panaeolus papilionaceus]|nr:hypothetical protein BJ165DRAFT_1496557 [Panaeolus papilionaceus]
MTSRLIIRTARKADLGAIRDVVTKAFVHREPTGRHLGFTEPEFYKLFDRFAPDIDYNTSVVAEVVHDKAALRPSELVCCHINTPFAAAPDVEGLTELTTMVHLLEELHLPFSDVLKKSRISEDRLLHSFMGATNEEYHGKGVYKKVLELFSQQTMRDSRWDAAVAECTSPITRHLKMTQLGWTEANFIRYEDYSYNGQKPLQELQGGASLVWGDYRRRN